MSSEKAHIVRRSERSVKRKRNYSPEPISKQNSIKKQKKSVNESLSLFDKKCNKKPIYCNKCKSSFLISSFKKIKKKSQQYSFPRYYFDSETNRMLLLCIGCGLAINDKNKKNQKKKGPTPEEKEKYFQEAKAFSLSLVDTLHDTDAERLFCPEFKIKPCACLQKYVIGEEGDTVEKTHERAIKLLKLLKEAKHLSQQKFHKNQDTVKSMGKTSGTKVHRTNIGLGNGQKRSHQFEDFVLKQRKYLREELHLCERATQKVLMYSNNFLHKRLRTEPERIRRIERKKGKAVLGLLKPISELPTEMCCKDNCVLIAFSHGKLLQQWRERAEMGQAEARRVLAEMLTPSGGIRTNCYKFISLVTGCSRSTISKVSDQMRLTGGDREPPQHGLKKFWQEQAKKNTEEKNKSANAEDGTLAFLCETIMSSNNIALNICTESVSTSDTLPISTLQTNIENISHNHINLSEVNSLKGNLLEESGHSVNSDKVQKQKDITKKQEIQNTMISQVLPVIENDIQDTEEQQLTFSIPFSNTSSLEMTNQPLLSHQVIVEGLKGTQVLSNLGSVIVIHSPLKVISNNGNVINSQNVGK